MNITPSFDFSASNLLSKGYSGLCATAATAAGLATSHVAKGYAFRVAPKAIYSGALNALNFIHGTPTSLIGKFIVKSEANAITSLTTPHVISAAGAVGGFVGFAASMVAAHLAEKAIKKGIEYGNHQLKNYNWNKEMGEIIKQNPTGPSMKTEEIDAMLCA
ncbi:MAG: hypothetical protein K0S74_997 [Chlamydiales bacterium]|jgi:hypothetical protein|nr:hypothetical protein [Chlamydiales bacterium]